MSDWIEVKLGDICEFISRGITPNYSDDGILVLNQKCIRDNRVNSALGRFTAIDTKINSSKLLKSGDILINSTGTGTLGRVSIYKGATNCVTVDSHVTILRMKEGVSPVYLGYFLHSIEPLIENLGRGSTNQKELSTGDLKRIRIVLPDITNQSKVAEQLSVFDSMIDNNSGRIELLEQAAQELYKEWFVRFRFPGYENVQFEDGIPEGWEIKRIVDLFDITSSKRVYLADYVDAGIPFYRSKEIIQLSQGQAITEPLYISNAAYENFKSKYGAPEKNDILITSVGTIGVSYLVDGHEFYFKDGNLTWIKSGSNKVLSLFLFQWLNSQSGKQQLLQSTIGTSQSALTIENLKKIKLLVPTKALIEDYYQKAHVMLEQKSALQMNNRNLAVQRNMLLPRLMNGKVEVN